MEYVEGETLKEYIERKGKLNDEEIKNLFTQMLDAVGYVHEQNLVHRDIKPSNFMLDKKGRIKLMDFGIAKTTDSNSAEYTQTVTGMQMGTPMYMSPEQVKSTKEVTFSTDIYSLGVVLWQIAAVRKPYDTSELSVPEIQVSILREPLPSLNTVWDRIIEKATQKEISNRYNTIDSFSSVIQDHKSGTEYLTTDNNLENTIYDDKPNGKADDTVIENFIIDESFIHRAKSYFISIAQELKWSSNVQWDTPVGVDVEDYYKAECFQYDFICLAFKLNNIAFSLGTIRHEWLIIFSSGDSIGFDNLDYVLKMSNELKLNSDDLNSLFKLLVKFKQTPFYTKIHDYFKVNSNRGSSYFLKDEYVNDTLNPREDYFNFIFNKLDPRIKKSIRWDTQITSELVDTFVFVSFEFKGTECAIVDNEFDYGGGILIEEENCLYGREGVEQIPILKEISHFIQSLLSEKEYFNYYKTKFKNTSFDQSSFNKLLSKHSIISQSKLYLSPNIPEKKQNNLLKSFPFDLIGEVSTLLLYDETIFGKCDEGLAILLAENGGIYLYIRDSSNSGLFSVNYQGLYIPHLKNITFGRWTSIFVNYYFYFGIEKSEFNIGIKHSAPKFNEFLNDLL
jgi:serine/threonine protein kinase